MPSFVRSDFRIALSITTPDGETHDAGRYTSESRLTQWGQGAPLSHLHRVSPDGRWLASFDVDGNQVQLRDVDAGQAGGEPGSMTNPVRVAIAGLDGDPLQVRWLAGGEGMSVATSKNLFVLPFVAARDDQVAFARPVFDEKARKRVTAIKDTRVLPNAVLVQTIEPNGNDHSIDDLNVYIVDTSVPSQPSARLLDVGGREVRNASVRSDGRFVVQLADDIAGQTTPTPRHELWTFAADGPRGPSLVGQRLCADPNWCDIVNWTPGSKRLVYAVAPHEVVLEVPHPREAPSQQRVLAMLSDDEYGESIHTLWMNDAEDRIAAANDWRVRMWDGEGDTLWTWDAPKRNIASVHFDSDQEAVVVGAGRDVLRVADGEATIVLTTPRPRMPKRRPAREEGDVALEWEHDSFVDGVTPLPGGAIAYMVVRTSRRDATWEESEPLIDNLDGEI